MEILAYQIKQRFPALFGVIEKAARLATTLRFGRHIRRARRCAEISGMVRGERAAMRPLDTRDIEPLHRFIEDLPSQHLQYFRPHGFDRASLQRVLSSAAFLTYGLFAGDRMIGYALLKIAPTGTAYIGLLIHPSYVGLGLGTFLVRFLYWQASMAGLRARSTISRQNPASLGSHRAVADYRVVAELPNEYLLIEFPPGSNEPPALSIV